MPSIFFLFPPFLLIVIAMLIILTIMAIILRRSLYRSLIDSAHKVSRLLVAESRGRQPKIVNKLETRFKQASSKLEQVNTMALIDGLYSQEELKFLGISFRYEQWDYFCGALPNLLLAFGLLGTFIGISYNLYNLSQTINQNATNVDNLVSQLQVPLQSMGIAFSTSLVAIACSSILIIVNLRCNTNFAKSCLISSLEDYLDNIFRIEVQGDTRLDRAVNRMVNQQQEFLERFHEKVGNVLETTLGNAANQMVVANQGFQNNVDSMVGRFNDVSGSMAASVNSFQQSAQNFKQQVQTIQKVLPQFTVSAEQINSGSQLYLSGAKRIEASKFSENLENITTDLATTQNSFATSTAFLGKQVQKMGDSNQQATDLAKQVYTELQTASGQLQDSSNGFVEAAKTLTESDFTDQLTQATNELITIPSQFKESTINLHQSSGILTMAIDKLNAFAQKNHSLNEQIGELNQHSSQLLENSDRNIQQEISSLNGIQSEVKILVNTLNKHKEQVNIGISNFGKTILTTFQEQTDKNITELQKLTAATNSNLNYLQNTKNEAKHLINKLEESQSSKQDELLTNQKSNELVNSTKYYPLLGLSQRLIKEVKDSDDIKYFQKTDSTQILSNEILSDIDRATQDLRQLGEAVIKYHQDHKCSKQNAEILKTEISQLSMNLSKINSVVDLLIMHRVIELLASQISRFKHSNSKYCWDKYIKEKVLNTLSNCL